jgi:hypothetical protein
MFFVVGPVETIARIKNLLVKKIDPVDQRNIGIDE